MYATELVYIVPSTWHQLRKATAEAINLSKGGSSSYISVAAMDPTLDPQFRGILRRTKFWRKFLDLFPMYHSWFLEKIECAAPKKYTLTGAFRKSLLDIGWTCMANGNMVHSSGLTVSWLNASIPFLKKMLIKVWGSFMLAQIQHRKHVDITECDLDAQSKVFKKLDCQKQGVFLTYCSGKHITGYFLCKFAGGSDCCPFCQEKDGRWHRIHDCTGLSDLRKEYAAAIRWLARQPVAITHYGLCPKDNVFFLKKDESQQRPHSLCSSAAPAIRVCHIHRWVCSQFRIMGISLLCWRIKVGTFGEPLPGHDHSSFRGESFAFLLTLNRYWSPCIFTDCQAVVNILLKMIRARSCGAKNFKCNHWDIWPLIWQHFLQRPPGLITVTKVPAHCDCKMMNPNSLEHWHAYCNDAADQLAKKTLKDAFRFLLAQGEDQLNRKNSTIQRMQNLALCVSQIAEIIFESNSGAAPEHTAVTQQQSFDDLVPGGVLQMVDCHLSEDVVNQCPFSSRFAISVSQRACQLQWPVHDAPQEPIS